MTTLNLAVSSAPDNGLATDTGIFIVGGVSGLLGLFFGIRSSHWYRFTGVSGLGGATIDSASLSIEVTLAWPPGLDLNVYAEKVAAPVIPVSAADYFAKTRTANLTNWSPAPGPLRQSVSVVTVIQELADAFDPSAIQILHREGASTAVAIIKFFGAAPNVEPHLDIDFTEPPPPPTFTATDPASPAISNTPRILGSAAPGSTVQLFTDAACTVPIGPPTPAADFAAPGIQVTVADSSLTTFWAHAFIGLATSPCSTDSISYQDLTPITILEVILNCIRLGLIVHPGTWASAVAASGFIAPSDALPLPSGYVPPGEYPPSPSGYIAKEDGTTPWDMVR